MASRRVVSVQWFDVAMRKLAALVGALMLMSCSPDTPDSSDESPAPIETTQSAEEARASEQPIATEDLSFDPCQAMTAAEVEALLGATPGPSRPGLTGATPNCQWGGDNGMWVQVISVDAAAWAQGLPEALAQIEKSGLFTDDETSRQLRESTKLIEQGTSPSSTESCVLFSQMLELQGKARGSRRIVTLIPDATAPQAIASQICSNGRFTSVMLANPAGLKAPRPTSRIARFTMVAHRRTL